jgi:hypothetical protein
MKKLGMFALLLTLATLTIGCKPAEKKEAAPPADAAAPPADAAPPAEAPKAE